MFSFESFFILALGWLCGTYRMPQRWLPVNPVTAAIEEQKRAREQQLVANMISAGQNTPTPIPASTPPTK